MAGLVDGGQRFYVEFESLIVLALDLQFGLKLLDQELETRDFCFEFLNVGGAGSRAIGRGHIEIVRGCVRRAVLLVLRSGRNMRPCMRLWRECIGECAGPAGFGARFCMRNGNGDRCWRRRWRKKAAE